MKHFYIIILLFSCSTLLWSQNYDFGIVHNGGNNFSIVATSDFSATDTDVSDIGFALMLPTGDANITNMSTFNSRLWSATKVTATQLTTLNLGDGTRDAFAMNLPPGQTILSHSNGTSFVLVTFNISNMPNNGLLELLSNADPIATGLGGAVDSFYNSNINNTTTQDYFGEFTIGQESFSFNTLSTPNISDFKNTITVFPNPALNFISIESSEVITSVEIFDVLGKSIYKTLETIKIPVSILPNGIYILKLGVKDRIFIKRFIKN